MINAPADSGQDWDALIAQTRIKVLEKLSRILGQDIASLIEEETHLSPLIAQKQPPTGGSLRCFK